MQLCFEQFALRPNSNIAVNDFDHLVVDKITNRHIANRDNSMGGFSVPS